MTQRKPGAISRERLQWKCSDLDCIHNGYCQNKVMFTDDGYIQIRGEMTFNRDDGKWDWCVSVDYYGSSPLPVDKVEALASRHARRMASLAHPEAVVLHAVNDEED